MTFLTETRERFLLAIVARVPAEQIAEIHFFAPIKQGGVESGVAVVAAWPEEPGLGTRDPRIEEPRLEKPESGSRDSELEGRESRVPSPESRVRPVVYTARYRLALKGPDRGKWETSIVAEADAPLVSVDAVVRGVQRRAGDVEDPTRMEGEDLRALVETVRRGAAVSP